MLYDTYGFPIEMTIEMAQQEGLRVDIEEFEEEMEKQRQKGRLAWKGDVGDINALSIQAIQESQGSTKTAFTGYNELQTDSRIQGIIYKNKSWQSLSEDDLSKNDSEEEAHFYLISEKTPFYAEAGGQLGDEGFIRGDGQENKFHITVTDTQKSNDIVLHVCQKLEGKISVGQEISS